jgi:hypothetical protein
LLPNAIAYPTLIKIAAAIYLGATAFEVAQNSADRWYLTEATRSVADLFFNSWMTVAFCLFTIGFANNIWMNLVAVALTLIFPFAYINNHPSHRGLNGIVVLLGTVSLYVVARDPTVLLFLVVNFFAVYIIVMMIEGRNQWLHGWGAFFFGVAFLAWPLGMMNAAKGAPISWLFAIALTIAVVAAAVALTPVMRKMPATPRVHGP